MDRALAALLALVLGATSPAAAQRSVVVQDRGGSDARIALVMGNAAYLEGPLRNPVNDARAVAGTLRQRGFQVFEVLDGSLEQMETSVREFGRALRRGGIGVFYYAGHGIQAAGENYLIPVDAVLEKEQDLRYNAMAVGQVLGEMEDAGNPLNIVILDACRNNPFARSWRSATRGLAQVSAPTGTLIAYATAPGSVASDGTGDNGLYTSELLRYMAVPDLPVEEMFKQVRIAVRDATGGRQTPWEASSLIGNFTFTANGPAEAQEAPQVTGPSDPSDPLGPVLALFEALPGVSGFGEAPEVVNEALGRPLADVAWGNLPVIPEFESADVRAFWASLRDLRSAPLSDLYSACMSDSASLVALFFDDGGLHRVSLRLSPNCPGREQVLARITQRFGLELTRDESAPTVRRFYRDGTSYWFGGVDDGTWTYVDWQEPYPPTETAADSLAAPADTAATSAPPPENALDVLFGASIGGFRPGSSPQEVNETLGRPFADVSWENMPVAEEFRPSEVRYLWLPLSRFEELPLLSEYMECRSDEQSSVVFFFDVGGLHRLEVRLAPSCQERAGVLDRISERFGLEVLEETDANGIRHRYFFHTGVGFLFSVVENRSLTLLHWASPGAPGISQSEPDATSSASSGDAADRRTLAESLAMFSQAALDRVGQLGLRPEAPLMRATFDDPATGWCIQEGASYSVQGGREHLDSRSTQGWVGCEVGVSHGDVMIHLSLRYEQGASDHGGGIAFRSSGWSGVFGFVLVDAAEEGGRHYQIGYYDASRPADDRWVLLAPWTRSDLVGGEDILELILTGGTASLILNGSFVQSVSGIPNAVGDRIGVMVGTTGMEYSFDDVTVVSLAPVR